MRLASLRAPVAMIFLGIVLFGFNACHNLRYPMRPLSLSVPLGESGFDARGDFVAALDGRYELELAFGPDSPEEQKRRLATAESSPVDLAWTVTDENGGRVAAGDCREFLYIDGWTPGLDRVLDRLFFRETEDLRHSNTRRGVGAFRAVAGERYFVQVRVGEATESADTRFVVRIGRVFWNGYVARTTPLVWAGVASGAAGALLLTFQLVARFVRRRPSS